MKKNREPGVWDSYTLKKCLKMMKWSVFFFFLSIVQVLAVDGYSQQTKLTLKFNQAVLEDVLNEIENKSEFYFLYNQNFVNTKKTVNLNVKDGKIDEVLNALFQNTEINYTISDRQIVLTNNANEQGLNNGSQQQKSVSGKITDSSGAPLPGCTIVIKGTTTGVITDMDGNYTISKVPENATLQFSFVGMKSQEIAVIDKSTINVTLVEEAIGIDEVVAIGYGTQKKGTMTSSVSVVKADDIKKSAVSDVSNTLAGKASGLIVRNFNAEPGVDASSIFVRGVSTTGNNDALIVVDGIPDRNLTLVDVNDIESVTVLKDASAVAPYGSRGANGVILITTKRGKVGKPTITYTTYYGVSKPTRLPKYCSSADYARMFNEASKNEGKAEPFSADDIAKYAAGNNPDYPNTQWWDEIVKKDPIQSQHNLAVSGANESVNYYLSVGAFRQDGYFSSTDFKKYNIRANIDAKITNDFKVSFDLSGYTGDKNSPLRVVSQAMTDFLEAPSRTPGTWPVKNGKGQYVKPTANNNAVADLELGGGGLTKNNNFTGTFTAEYKPSYLPGLTFKGLGVYDYGVSDQKIWKTPYTIWRMVDRMNSIYEEIPPSSKPSLYESVNFSTTKQIEFHADYKRTIAEKHNLGALIVFNRTEWNTSYLEGMRINFPSSAINQLFAGPQADQYTNGSAFEGARLGYIGRLTYDYNTKYMFECNFRYDGSMKFAPEKRWGFFPSIALGWRISEENFIKNNYSFIDNLKLRGSWGKAGNDRVGDFQYLGTYGLLALPYSFGGSTVQTAKEARLPNPNITWETASSTNLGLEGSFWKGLLTFETDYFFKRTDNILRPTQKTSSIIGISLPDANIGVVENKGIEFMIGHRNHLKDIKYNASFVFTYATNKAIELGESEGTLNDPFRRQTGNPLNSYYGAIAEGLFTSAEEIANSPSQGGGIVPGDIKYKDISGPEGKPDGKIDYYDETKIGYSQIPEIIYGLNLGVEYKGFDLTLNFQGATHVNYRFGGFAANAFDNGGNIQQWQKDERWTPENNNPNARYPRLTTAPTGNNTKGSTYWLRDGTYLRLKTAQIGYNIDPALISRLKIKGLRIYLSGQNLFTWVKDDLMKFDPEAYNDRGQFYPQAKIYTLGLNLTF